MSEDLENTDEELEEVRQGLDDLDKQYGEQLEREDLSELEREGLEEDLEAIGEARRAAEEAESLDEISEELEALEQQTGLELTLERGQEEGDNFIQKLLDGLGLDDLNDDPNNGLGALGNIFNALFSLMLGGSAAGAIAGGENVFTQGVGELFGGLGLDSVNFDPQGNESTPAPGGTTPAQTPDVTYNTTGPNNNPGLNPS